jgi:hypothetical protein|uniref:Uncharacterized protein n=1 Tax=viral metagenome TaxID=1070528 RepID=A0A6C0J147_9ZZZZ
MNFKRLLYTDLGRIILSIILGLGLATLFRKICTDKSCLRFNGPIISDLEGKIYKHGDKCYKYSANTDKCDTTKKQVDLMSTETEDM